MKSFMKLLLAVSLFATFLFAEKVVTDQLGRKVVLPDEVKRIVVLQHQSLNVLVQLGATDKIVGVLKTWEENLGKEYVRLAPTLKDMPLPGDLKVINYEAVMALKPDVVIVANYIPKEYIAKMEELKIPVIGVSFSRTKEGKQDKRDPSFEDEVYAYDNGLYDGVLLLGEVSGKQKEAKELVEYVKSSQEQVKAMVGKIDLQKRAKIYVANPNLSTYGSGKYTGIMLERAGGENVAKKDIKGFAQVSVESVLGWNPEVIFVQSRYPEVVGELKANGALSTVSAIKNNKIYLMPEYAKSWGFPTPEAMALGELWVAKKLYPKEFESLDLEKKVDEYYAKFYRAKYGLSH